MAAIYFNSREGQTVLSPGERDGLLLDHISVMHELDEAEQANIQSGLLWLRTQKGEILTDRFLRVLHKKLFGSVWRWAGNYRKSEKNIGVAHWKIPGEIKKLLDDTGYWLEHKTYPPTELMARFHHRLVKTHPFPNGNGRFSRIMTNLLCDRNSWNRPSWGALIPPGERRQKYISALQSADMKKFSLIIDFLAD